MNNIWNYRNTSWLVGGDLVGYEVAATDGSIGKVDDATDETGSAHLVVDTGFWIFGKKRVIPAGTVTAVDHDSQIVTVSMTKDDVRSAPDYEESVWDDEGRTRYSDYYGPWSW